MLHSVEHRDCWSNFTGYLANGRTSLDAEDFLQRSIVAPDEYFVEDRHRRSPQSGLRITTPSTVGVRPPVSSITSLSRSPPGAMKETGVVLSSDGVTPAVPPPWIGVLSWIVSLPEKIVSLELTPVARMSRMIEQGYGVHSYCQPESGLNPSWFAVSA